jgi:hypothetical protein
MKRMVAVQVHKLERRYERSAVCGYRTQNFPVAFGMKYVGNLDSLRTTDAFALLCEELDEVHRRLRFKGHVFLNPANQSGVSAGELSFVLEPMPLEQKVLYRLADRGRA